MTTRQLQRLRKRSRLSLTQQAKNVVFRSGLYQPGTPAGQRLLAHELTHVIQQSRGPADGTTTGDGIAVSNPSDPFERAADEIADRVISAGGIESYISATQRRGDESVSPASDILGQRHVIPAGPGKRSAQRTSVQRQEGDTKINGNNALPKDTDAGSPNSQDQMARVKQTPVRSDVVDSRASQDSAILHLQRAAGNHAVSRLLARQRAPSGAAPAVAPGVEAVVEQDITANKALFLAGLNSAATRFGADVHAQLEAEKVENHEALWVNFGMALASLAMPLLCPIVGLNPVGLGLILGTFKLTMDPALNDPEKATEAALEKAVTDYVIGPTGSIAAGINSVDSKAAASTLVARHKEPTSDQARIAVAQELFQSDVLVGYQIRAEKVNAHVHDGMMRMWNLQTVGARAYEAFGAKCAGAVCGDDAVIAFAQKAFEVFPDLLDKMNEYMPERYDYWHKRHWRLNSFDIHPFERDINILAQEVSSKEFGTRPPHERPGFWPRLELRVVM